MRAYQVPITISCVLSSMVPIAAFATTTVGACTGTPPTKTDPPGTYAPLSGNPQNCFAMVTQVSGERECSNNSPGVVCIQWVVQLPLQVFFYTFSTKSGLCEETLRTYVGVDEADDCENPKAAK
jgi:hypothetical protein